MEQFVRVISLKDVSEEIVPTHDNLPPLGPREGTHDNHSPNYYNNNNNAVRPPPQRSHRRTMRMDPANSEAQVELLQQLAGRAQKTETVHMLLTAITSLQQPCSMIEEED
ncbi:unnamed protein product, partial [Polarella glacialis]